MITLAKRMQEALDHSGKRPADLARACNVSPPSVSNWLSGETKSLKSATAIRAANFLGVSQLWLTEGRGSMTMADGMVVVIGADQSGPCATLEDRIDHASAAVVSVLKAASLDALCFGDIQSIKAAMKSGPQETYSLEEILRAAVRVFVEEHDKIKDMNEDELCQVITAFLRNAREVTQRTKKK